MKIYSSEREKKTGLFVFVINLEDLMDREQKLTATRQWDQFNQVFFLVVLISAR